MPSPRSVRTVVAAVAGLLASLGVAVVLARGSSPAAAPAIEAGITPAQFAQERTALIREVPAAQAAALADQRVTASEYEAAVRRSMACLRRELLASRPAFADRPPTFTAPAWSPDCFTFAFGFRLPVDDLDPRPIDRSCQERFSRTVEAVFHLQRWADAAYVARSAAAFHACLDRAHLPGRRSDAPRARFEAVLAAPEVDDQDAIEARKCIGARPSIGDLTP